jgi:predicted short-subunit dehydrogenase-like oxidoreductase (DUF2520 family)
VPQTAPKVAFVGPGRVGRSLAFAFRQAGIHVVGTVGRGGRLEAADSMLEGIPALSAAEAMSEADWIWLTVPDGQIRSVSETLAWAPHHVAVHCSGATELSAMASAQRAGAGCVGFHPIQIFSQPAVAVKNLRNASVGIEVAASPNSPSISAAASALKETAVALAERLGMRPLHIQSGQRALYHAGAGFAASALVSVMAEACELWRRAGIPTAEALTALMPLAQTSLETFGATGRTGHLSGAVAGPVARGDLDVIDAHLRAFAHAGIESALYRAVARKQVSLMVSGDALPADVTAAMEARLTTPANDEAS